MGVNLQLPTNTTQNPLYILAPISQLPLFTLLHVRLIVINGRRLVLLPGGFPDTLYCINFINLSRSVICDTRMKWRMRRNESDGEIWS
jgi:hypothetical protein